MKKEEYIEVFNAMIRGTSVSFQDKLFPMVSEYLTEINYENYQEVINLIGQNPQLVQQFMPDLIKHYCRKHDIISLQKQMNPDYFKTILYYG